MDTVFFRLFYLFLFPCKSCNPAARERLGNLHRSARDFWMDTRPHMRIWLQDWGQYVTLKKNNRERDMNHTRDNIFIKIHSAFKKALKNQSSSSYNLRDSRTDKCRYVYTHTNAHAQKIYESCKDHWNSLRTPLQPRRGARSFFIALPPRLGGLLILSKMISPLYALFLSHSKSWIDTQSVNSVNARWTQPFSAKCYTVK